MGKKKRQPDSVTFKLDGPRIKAECFIKGVNTFFELIEDVANEVTGSKKSIDWIVSVKPGSIIIGAAPEAISGQRGIHSIISALQRGIVSLATRKVKPKYFSDSALRKVHDLSVLREIYKIEEISITVNNKHANITSEYSANIDAITGISSKSYGTIEGTLEAIDIHKKPKISVYDDMTARPVKCYFAEGILDTIISAIGKRVSVYGLIKYRKCGIPVSVDIEELEVFPPKEKLPTYKDMLGILNN